MFVPLAWRADACAPPCSPGAMAIVGTDPSGAATTSAVNDTPDADTPAPNSTPVNGQPGVQRFIGIAMVAVMLLAILFLWLYTSKRPRDKSSTYPHWVTAYFCCGRRRKKAAASSSKWTQVALPVAEQSMEELEPPRTPVVSEKERSKMLQSEPRRLVKEVSGGVVMYTEVPRPAMPKRERYPVDWEFERAHAPRSEARTPHRHPERSRPSRKSSHKL